MSYGHGVYLARNENKYVPKTSKVDISTGQQNSCPWTRDKKNLCPGILGRDGVEYINASFLASFHFHHWEQFGMAKKMM